MSTYPGGQLDVYDQGNGSINVAWPPFSGVAPDSYHVYVNGVLNQTVTTRLATVSGLTQDSYSSSTAAAPSGNSARPQNMPPVGEVTPSGTYTFTVVAVKSGVEVAALSPKTVTVNPTSQMLTTPMARVYPFPQTGLD